MAVHASHGRRRYAVAIIPSGSNKSSVASFILKLGKQRADLDLYLHATYLRDCYVGITLAEDSVIKEPHITAHCISISQRSSEMSS